MRYEVRCRKGKNHNGCTQKTSLQELLLRELRSHVNSELGGGWGRR